MVAVLILAAALRFNHIARWSLNNDEIAEVTWSAQSFHDMLAEVRQDAVHPPLDYFVHFAIVRMHGPEWLDRLPAAIFGIGTVGLIMLLASMWSGPVAAVAAGLLAALAPTHVRFSQEVRPYSMALFFVCASLAALELYVRARAQAAVGRPGARGSRTRTWAAIWFVMVFLAGSALYFAGLVAGAASVFRIFVGRRDELRTIWRRLPLVIGAWTLLYLPWLFIVIGLAGHPPAAKAETLNRVWWIYRAQTFATGDWRFEQVSLGSWAFWLFVAAGIFMTIRFRSLGTAVFWLVGGTALEVAVLQIHPHFSTPRYLMPSWPPAFILAGAAFEVLWRNAKGRAVAAFVMLLFAGHAALTLQAYFHGARSEWRHIAEYVHERAGSGETVIVANNWASRNFWFYWRQLPARPDVGVIRFATSPEPWAGPVWVVTGQCFARAGLDKGDVMGYWPMTEEARVYFVRNGEQLPMSEELCPE